MLRTILIRAAIVLFLAFITICALVYISLRPGLKKLRARQEVLQQQQPRVLLGESLLARTTFASFEGVGAISQITAGEAAKREDADLVVVGSLGAIFLNNSGRVVKQISFSGTRRCAAEVVNLNDGGEYAYLNREEHWWCDVVLYDEDGKAKWTYHSPGINDSAVAHLPDGHLAVGVGLYGAEGLVLLDENGKELWRQNEEQVWHVEVLKINSHDVIFYSNVRGHLLGRDTNGREIVDYSPEFRVSDFSLTRWATEPTPTHLLIPGRTVTAGQYDSIIRVLDSEGHHVDTLPMPMGTLFKRTNAAPVQFGQNARYFAVIQSDLKSRSMLVLYNPALRLAYQEVLGDACSAITAVTESSGQSLVVGCTNKVFEYRLNLTPTSAGTQ